MPTLFIHGVGIHDLAQFRATFLDLRDRLRAQTGVPEAAFFPIFWGDWGPHSGYRGRALGRAQAKSAAFPPAPTDAGLEAIKIVLSAPGPLREALDDLGLSEAELAHAVAQTAGQPRRATATMARLLVREQLAGRGHPIAERRASREALQALLALILDEPRAMAKGLPAAATYPFWATVTALARHLRGSIMELATSFVGDVMLYLARGAEVRQFVHAAVMQACALRPGEPLTLIAHSLGGVIAYDYLADPAFPDRPPVDLLVTVGSQVGLFAEYGLIEAGQHPRGLRRWLNIYDPDDFLSFPIGGMFPEAAAGDRGYSSGQPFPLAHGAYWDNDAVIGAIATAITAAGRVQSSGAPSPAAAGEGAGGEGLLPHDLFGSM